MPTICHISDLHFGRKTFSKSLNQLAKSIKENDIDHIILTGDITDGGTVDQYNHFHNVFKEFIEQDRLIMVPGNHDHLGDGVASYMIDQRVKLEDHGDFYVIRVDSTGDHNKFILFGYGLVCYKTLKTIDTLLDGLRKDKLTILALHHHLVPLPEEGFWERVSKHFGWPFTNELHFGKDLLDLCRERVHIALHGHKHLPFELDLPGERTLSIYNAGCTPRLRKYRVFTYKQEKLTEDVKWIHY